MAEEPKQATPDTLATPALDAEPIMDAAGQSLTNALRISFRILTAIIVILVALFFTRGFFTVKPNQTAIVLRFGKIDRVVDRGIHYALPYPLEEVAFVDVTIRRLEINTFWPKVTEKTKEDLQTGKVQTVHTAALGAEDGFMLTGDTNVLQSRWTVTYHVNDAGACFAQIGSAKEQSAETRLIKGLLQNAVVRKTAAKPISEVYPIGESDLSELVQKAMQDSLAEFKDEGNDCGITVDDVTSSFILLPKEVQPHFDAVRTAERTRLEHVSNAEREANGMLVSAAGSLGPEIGSKIAEWWEVKEKIIETQQRFSETPKEVVLAQEGKLGEGAEDVRDYHTKLQEIEKEIDELIEQAGGAAATIMADAEAYKTRLTEEAKRDEIAVRRLVEEGGNIGMFMDIVRTEAVEYVLMNAYEKFLFKPEEGHTKETLELWLTRRGEILRGEHKIEDIQ